MVIVLGEIKISVARKEIKNIHLSVNPPVGEVRISAPIGMSDHAIRAFAITKLSWIKQERKKFQEQEREPEREFLDRESHYVWGKRYLLEIIESDETPNVCLKHSNLVITVRHGWSRDKVKALLDEWYRNQIKEAVPELVAKYSKVLNVSIDKLFVQEMKTQWGGCNPTEGNIRLNTDLARKPLEFLEYVVLHEMIHLIEPTHKARFTALMNQLMPNWRYIRDELNRLPLKEIQTRDITI